MTSPGINLRSMVLAAAGFLVSLAARGAEPSGAVDPNRAVIVRAHNEFALTLYGELARKAPPTENLVLSPYGTFHALALVYCGARGTTAEQLAQVLHWPREQQALPAALGALNNDLARSRSPNGRQGEGETKADQSALHLAHAVWGHKGIDFTPDFVQRARTHFRAEVAELPFADNPEAARAAVNRWVAQQTRERIRELLGQPLPSGTDLVLTSAVYLQAPWVAPFDRSMTRPQAFRTAAGPTIDVPMMSQVSRFRTTQGDGAELLELPYAGNGLVLLVLLPEKADGLAELEENLTVDQLARWLQSLRLEKLQVYLPRFHTSAGFNLLETLLSLGLTAPFGSDADFSGMTAQKGLRLSAVVHKAYLGVDEQGTEATAATAVVVERGLAVHTFRVDRPFVFVLHDRDTGSILFLGRVANPGP